MSTAPEHAEDPGDATACVCGLPLHLCTPAWRREEIPPPAE